MTPTITIDGKFLRYGDFILNRCEVCEVNIRNGVVLMRSGHSYDVPTHVLQQWFSDHWDYAKEGGGYGQK